MPIPLVKLLLFIGLLTTDAQGQGVGLGPKDPTTFPPTDTSRVAVGSQAPDFTLESLSGPPVTLSQFRDKQKVVLVFYRGHW